MKNEQLSDIFVIPLSEKKYMIYNPKSKIIFSTNKESLLNLSNFYEILKKQQKNKVMKENQKIKNKSDLTLCLTTDCNLRCRYCYASGGDKKAYMNWNLAKKFIDYILLKSKSEFFSLGFHGGGEPTLAFDLMKRTVLYAKEKCKEKKIKFKTSCATNGILSEEKLDWIIDNKMRLAISFDGTPKIQDIQRPFADGKPSHSFVENTVKRLVDEKQDFGVRSTITQLSVNKMDEIINYFHKLGIKSVHFEPAFECGRCLKTKTHSPSPYVFIKNFIKAFELAEKYDMELYYSGGAISKLTDRFCGAAGENFFVTTDGYITSCLEVMHKEDPTSKIFFYGRYNEKTKNIEIFEKKLDLLSSRTVDKIKECQSCFCKWHCAGDCLVKSFRLHNSLFKVGGDRCLMNREITNYTLLRCLNNPIKMKGFDFSKKIEVC